MLRDVDATLETWLGGLVPDVAISFGPPAREPADKRKNAATLWVHLHGVREDPDGGLSGWGEVRDHRGVVVGRTHPSRRYRFTYLLMATATETLMEHELLGRVLVGAAREEVIPVRCLSGELAGAEHDVLVRCAPAGGTADPQHLWSTWECPARTALELLVLAPMPAGLLLPVPSPPSRVDVHTSRRGGVVEVPEPDEGRPRLTRTLHEH